ncbi:MAG: cell division protein ZapB [Nitrospirota bacterium]|nr:cell division protein ZapB [Nitrospirota bacterium]
MTPENENLGKLEERVLRLLKKLEAASKEVDEYRALNEEKDRQIQDLKDKVLRLQKQKGVVKDKVDGLLGRIDGLV